jgi:hypothetical protein
VFQIADAAVPTHDVADAHAAHGRLVGLHAKIYLASSRKGSTRLVVTSANATPSGWAHNVEVAVTGLAKAKGLQVPALLTPAISDAQRTFRGLLEELTPSAVESEETDPEWIKKARRVLAGATVVGQVRKGPPRILTLTIHFLDNSGDWPDGVEVAIRPFGYDNSCTRLTLNENCMSGSVKIDDGIELTPFVALTLSHCDDAPLEIVLAMQLGGDLDWDRESAHATLAKLARPGLYRELLWHFGVKGRNSKSPANHPHKIPKKAPKKAHLPILEKVLLRVHGPNAEAEIAAIDRLLAGLTNDPEDERLSNMWRLVKESLE